MGIVAALKSNTRKSVKFIATGTPDQKCDFKLNDHNFKWVKIVRIIIGEHEQRAVYKLNNVVDNGPDTAAGNSHVR